MGLLGEMSWRSGFAGSTIEWSDQSNQPRVAGGSMDEVGAWEEKGVVRPKD